MVKVLKYTSKFIQNQRSLVKCIAVIYMENMPRFKTSKKHVRRWHTKQNVIFTQAQTFYNWKINFTSTWVTHENILEYIFSGCTNHNKWSYNSLF